ncbi:MAG TPA: hypothetical protein VG227_06305 [Caulobacteraceae bacterium]|jgi:hypothetical protein|nr:hypothetical protein [Caulobacteraceae bacterium]
MKLQHVLIACAGAALVAGCEDYYGPGYYGPDYYSSGYYGPEYAPDYGYDADYYGPAADLGFDAYYDGYYGPLYDGYWRSGAFYYRNSPDSGFRRGDTSHFRSAPAPGFNHVHGMTRAAPRARAPG